VTFEKNLYCHPGYSLPAAEGTVPGCPTPAFGQRNKMGGSGITPPDPEIPG